MVLSLCYAIADIGVGCPLRRKTVTQRWGISKCNLFIHTVHTSLWTEAFTNGAQAILHSRSLRPNTSAQVTRSNSAPRVGSSYKDEGREQTVFHSSSQAIHITKTTLLQRLYIAHTRTKRTFKTMCNSANWWLPSEQPVLLPWSIHSTSHNEVYKSVGAAECCAH